MKKQLLTLSGALSLYSTSALSQSENKTIGLRLPTQKGSFTVGSDLMFGKMDFGDSPAGNPGKANYDVTFSPRVGYFVADNLMLGVAINSRFNGSASDYCSSRFDSKSFGVEIFTRRYLGSMTERTGALKKLRFFLEGGGGYSRNWVSLVQSDNEPTLHATSNQFSVYVASGLSYFITPDVAIEAGLKYESAISPNYWGPNNQLKFQVGLKVFLGGKKKSASIEKENF